MASSLAASEMASLAVSDMARVRPQGEGDDCEFPKKRKTACEA